MVRVSLLLLALGGCGRLDFSEHRAADAVVSDGDGDGGGDGAVVASVCGPTALFTDGFDDGVPAPLFAATMNAGVTVSEVNSNLELAFAAATSGGLYSFYRSVSTYAVAGLCMITEVAGTPDVSEVNAGMYFKLYDVAAGLQAEFFEFGGSVALRTHTGNTVTTVATVPWAPIADRFLRLRQQAGVMHWDTSPDGIGFTERASVSFAATAAQVELGAGAVQNITNGGTASFASATATGP